ncbi:ligase-associated DNA damage response endonuclease PdeM [Alteromonas sp. CI.11.F.A3]|uniref:ligase-associated DNA damage response endonuclease PdeM n=1 Tax=Alteromonas sp. CI.11.F.A3 TaxID=3079555 RepID=UPI002941BE9E|nr:ligase-associated DNA damage response endonuclease PdeM [Alteromonas sp. CI.11.F.A3]WOI37926.1 ligase-associated DNA damage response endonuclease PdeM [Alteromonas sp. CI.11.F.A3]
MAINEQWLSAQVALRSISIVKFAKMLWLLDARGVAYLPALDWLVVSDLHLEKGSYLRSYGNPLPSVDSVATLKRLQQIIRDYNPARVISLGDSFHDKHSMSRMTAEDRNLLCDIINSVPKWDWVEGNHDPDLPEGIPGNPCHEIVHSNVVFRHEPEIYEPEPCETEPHEKESHEKEPSTKDGVQAKPQAKHQIIGHYHPKIRKTISRRRFSGKCFVVTEDLFIMPAFGQFTGGLDVDEEVMLVLASKKSRACYMLYDGTIFKA